jgi:hypothetical protein
MPAPADLTRLDRIPECGNPLVVRTDFEDQATWERVSQIIRESVRVAGYVCQANVDLLEDLNLRNVPREELFEYACHEGNYAMEGMLKGARAEEAKKK